MSEKAPDPSKRIENVDKAWAMAHAEKPFRDHVINRMNSQRKVLDDRYDSLKDAISSGDITSIVPNDEEQAWAVNYEGKTEDEARNLSPVDTVAIAKKLVEGEDWRTYRVHTQYVRDPILGFPGAYRLEIDNGIFGRGGMHPDMPDQYAPRGSKLKDMTDAERKEYDKKPVDPSRTRVSDLAAKEAEELYDLTHPEDKVV